MTTHYGLVWCQQFTIYGHISIYGDSTTSPHMGTSPYTVWRHTVQTYIQTYIEPCSIYKQANHICIFGYISIYGEWRQHYISIYGHSWCHSCVVIVTSAVLHIIWANLYIWRQQYISIYGHSWCHSCVVIVTSTVLHIWRQTALLKIYCKHANRTSTLSYRHRGGEHCSPPV